MTGTPQPKPHMAAVSKWSTPAQVNLDLEAVAAQVGAWPACDHYYSNEANYEELVARALEGCRQAGPATATDTS